MKVDKKVIRRSGIEGALLACPWRPAFPAARQQQPLHDDVMVSAENTHLATLHGIVSSVTVPRVAVHPGSLSEPGGRPGTTPNRATTKTSRSSPETT